MNIIGDIYIAWIDYIYVFNGKMVPHVPRPHVPQNEGVAVYCGIFLNVPSMYPYTIDWGLILHVPKVMLMYLTLKLGIDPSCTQSNPHVPL